MPHDREVVGSNPARCWACSSLPNQWCVLNQVPHRGATLLIFLKKIFMLSCAAWGRASLISTDWAKKKAYNILDKEKGLFGQSALFRFLRLAFSFFSWPKPTRYDNDDNDDNDTYGDDNDNDDNIGFFVSHWSRVSMNTESNVFLWQKRKRKICRVKLTMCVTSYRFLLLTSRINIL